MNKIVTVGVVLAAVLAMVGCEMSEGMEEAENRRAQASAMVVAGMKRLNVAEFSGKAGESLAEAKLCGHGSVSPEERALLHRMQETRLVAISFRPPATLKDAVEFFHLASAPVGEREKAIDIRVDAVTDAYGKRSIPEIKAFDISLYDAIKLIADSTGFRLEIRGKQVVLKECVGCKLSMVKFGGGEVHAGPEGGRYSSDRGGMAGLERGEWGGAARVRALSLRSKWRRALARPSSTRRPSSN